MSDLMEWILILVVAHNFLSVWIISGILDKILSILAEMNAEKKGDR